MKLIAKMARTRSSIGMSVNRPNLSVWRQGYHEV